MVSKEQKKLERVVNFMKKGLQSLSDDLEDTIKGINDFIKSLNKALKDLKDVEVVPDVKTVSTSSKKVVMANPETAKTAAASTLFNLLSGSGPESSTPASASNIPAAPSAPAMSGPPKKPVSGPPKKPPSGGGPPKAPSAPSTPPKAPVAGGPQRSNLPPAPKLPPAPGSGPPKAPSGSTVQTPSFAKRPSAPMAPPGGAPKPPGASAAPPPTPVTPQAGGGLSSLRDEMLEELNRLKKIMRGE
jgi:hypothetical protein